jgi:hypothetical protein
MSAGRHQANIVFLLPAFPCIALWIASGVSEAGVKARGLRMPVALALLLLLGAVEGLRVHPHHLMFFNLWAGGPSRGPRFLIHHEDWGQDRRRLGIWQRENGYSSIFYAAYGHRPEHWGIVGAPVPCEPTPGIYALHAVEVHRPLFSLRPGCIDWLTVEPPDERIGYSIYIYRVDERRIERLNARPRDRVFWSTGRRKGTGQEG